MSKLTNIKKTIRILIFELIIYAVVVVAYFLFVLRYLKDWLGELYQGNLIFYAAISLGLIVIQAAFLEIVTSFLMSYTIFDRAEE